MIIALKVLEDNYSYFFYTENEAIAFDFVEYEYILELLSCEFDSEKFQVLNKKDIKHLKRRNKKRNLIGFFTTQGHWDHSSGDKEMSKYSKRYVIENNESITLGNWFITGISTPCHTRDSVCYYVENDDSKNSYIITGDTLFYLGCGKFFEGNAEEMFENFKKLSQLKGICLYGHDYNDKNLLFNLNYDNEIPEDVKNKKILTMDEEKNFNIFMLQKTAEELRNFRNLKNKF